MEHTTSEELVVAYRELLAFLNTSAHSDFILAENVKTLEQIHNVLAGIKKRQDEQQVIMRAILG